MPVSGELVEVASELAIASTPSHLCLNPFPM